MTSALSPAEFLRSIAASRDTLGRARMKLLDVVAHVRALTDDAPYCVIGGLAQILWARKTHTDDLDIALAASDVDESQIRVDREVVDLVVFEDDGFNAAIISDERLTRVLEQAKAFALL